MVMTVMLARLREVRERTALSQEDLAQRVGLTRVTVTRLEGGQPARPSTTRRLARALGVRVAELMGPESERPSQVARPDGAEDVGRVEGEAR
jgi:transcriptional regulator with XRE-family HTH domain